MAGAEPTTALDPHVRAMKVVRHPVAADFGDRPWVVTLGNFDGVHRGHQEIVARAVKRARELGGGTAGVTFEPHPLSVLAPGKAPLLLSSLRERLLLLGHYGLDVVVLQHFTPAFSAIEAEGFVREYLVRRLRARHVVVGHKVGFGYGRRGDADLLRTLGSRLGFGVDVVPPVFVSGESVSSSEIRAAVERAELHRAGEMLGRPFRVSGRVVRGDERGRKLGFPTANLSVAAFRTPPNGVYAVHVCVGDAVFPGVANLGVKPTFGAHQRILEAHLLDFDGSLYGRRIEVAFLERLRGEEKFASVAALVEQVRRDMEAARRVLSMP